MSVSREINAARALAWAETAMKAAASALEDVGTDDARQHAAEMRGAIRMARRWELALRKMETAA